MEHGIGLPSSKTTRRHGLAIPRYTDEDKKKLAAMYEDDVFQPGLTFGDAYKDQIFSTLVPLEEGILDTCFYKRIVLTGDAWHKVFLHQQKTSML
jgi:hypothetical protein